MESIKYTVKLDLTDNGTINTGWRIKQGDFRNIILIVKVVNNNEVYFSAENIPSILFHRPDGKTVIGKMDAYANDCYAYSIIGNELAVAGPVVMDVKFNDNGRTSTASCVFECVVDTIDGNATPADIYPGITLEEVQEKATVVATDVATEVATIVAEEIAKEYASSGITLTSASPLESSAAAGIAGLSAKGKSEQKTTQYIATVQGAMTNAAIGQPINQNVSSNANRCLSDVVYLPSGSIISISGYEFYVYYSSAASGNIEDRWGWINTYTVATSGYYRIMVNSSSAITPSSFVLSVAIAPTPTNPIAIVDASGEVVAHNTPNILEFNNIVLGKSWNDDNNVSRGYVDLVLEGGKTYTASTTSYNGLSTITIMLINGSGVGDSRRLEIDSQGRYTVTFVYESRFVKARMLFVAPSGTLTKEMCAITNPMVEEGTTASEYVEYKSNEINLSSIGIDLRSVGNVKDELIVKPDGGKIIRRIGAYTFNGTESWNWITSDKSAWVEVPQMKKAANYIGSMMCDRFAVTTNHTTLLSAGDGITGYNDSSNKYTTNWIYLRYSSATTLDALKTWLASNPITVYYLLSTPTEETLTSEQVAAILALQTYAGTTIVESELDEVVVDYVGDTKGYIDSKFEYLYELIRSYHPEAQMMSLVDEPTAEEEESENV